MMVKVIVDGGWNETSGSIFTEVVHDNAEYWKPDSKGNLDIYEKIGDAIPVATYSSGRWLNVKRTD